MSLLEASSACARKGSKKVCVAWATGCPRSEADVTSFFTYFELNGWQVTQDIRQADLVLFCGCAVIELSEDISLKLMSIACRRMKPGAQLVAYGCLPAITGEEKLRGFHAIPVASKDVARLDDLIGAKVKFRDVPEPNEFAPRIRQAGSCFSTLDHRRARLAARKRAPLPSAMSMLARRLSHREDPYDNENDDSVFSVRVVWSCLGECSYCGLRQSMGRFRSKPMDRVLAEMRKGLSAGFDTFRLVGADVGAYGQDIGSNIAELLGNITTLDGDYGLILVDLNANWMIKYPQSAGILAAGRAKVHRLQVPVQSGSDRILAKMRRPYTGRSAVQCLNDLRSACPDAHHSTHIIVGFPGETEEDFLQTVEMLRQAGGVYFNIHKYSDRPRTEAAAMPDKVPDDIQFDRIRRLKEMFPERYRMMT